MPSNPNLGDAVLEAGQAIYGRAAATDAYKSLLSVDHNGVVQVGSGLTGVALAGSKIAAGSKALSGTNPTTVATGLTSISGVALTLNTSTAPGVNTTTLTYTVSGGTISVYAWKPTSSANPTLIASTGTENFGWIAYGA